MADLPKEPVTRQEMYLSRLAGENTTLPIEPVTREEMYLEGAIDRVEAVEQEVEEIKNNPDVVDIVDTYADLQAYDTQHLTENDIIRVLQDETHSGNSTYYRFTKNPDTWTFIGEVSGGAETVKTLTSADYNYPTDNPNGLAPWLLDPGLYYTTEAGMNIYDNSGSSGTSDGNAFYVARDRNGAKSVLRLVNQNWIYTDYTAAGARSTLYTLLGTNKIQQTTGSSTSDVMSQKAVTSMIYHDPTIRNRIKIGNGASDNIADNGVEIGHDTSALATGGLAIGNTARVNSGATDGIAINFSSVSGSGSIGIGYDTSTSAERSVAIGRSAQTSAYRTIAVGAGAKASSSRAIAIGEGAQAGGSGTIALGAGSKALTQGEMNIGVPNLAGIGYNNSDYRLLTGLYDPQTAHDAATKGYVDGLVGDVAAALSAINNGTGA